MTTETRITFHVEHKALGELSHIDLRSEAAHWLLGLDPDDELSRDDITDELRATSTEEPFAQHPVLAYRLDMDDRDWYGEVLVIVDTQRVGIAQGGDAQWASMHLAADIDLTTEAGGERFYQRLRDVVDDYLNDADRWEARA